MSDDKYLRQDDFSFCVAHVVEECGEVLAAAGKLQRWGRQSFDPTVSKAKRETNQVWLHRELQDLKRAIERLEKLL